MTSVQQVAFFGTITRETPRNRVLYRGLRTQNVAIEVVDAPNIATVWGKEIKQQWLITALCQILVENAVVFLTGIININTIRDVDVVLIPSGGDYCTFAVVAVAKLCRKPVLLDGHGTIYYTQIHGRQYYPPGSLRGRVYYALDKATILITDSYLAFSHAMKERYAEVFDVDPENFTVVYTGALRPGQETAQTGGLLDERGEENETEESIEPPVDILYWGTFIPFHGTEIAIRALAKATEQVSLNVVFAGDGECRENCRALAEDHALQDVKFPGWVPRSHLESYIRHTDATLGVFGENPYIELCITNKICEAAARGKPIVTRRSPAVKELFNHTEDAYLTPASDHREIADAIVRVTSNSRLREELSKGAKETYEEHLSPEAVGKQFLDVAESL